MLLIAIIVIAVVALLLALLLPVQGWTYWLVSLGIAVVLFVVYASWLAQPINGWLSDLGNNIGNMNKPAPTATPLPYTGDNTNQGTFRCGLPSGATVNTQDQAACDSAIRQERDALAAAANGSKPDESKTDNPASEPTKDSEPQTVARPTPAPSTGGQTGTDKTDGSSGTQPSGAKLSIDDFKSMWTTGGSGNPGPLINFLDEKFDGGLWTSGGQSATGNWKVPAGSVLWTDLLHKNPVAGDGSALGAGDFVPLRVQGTWGVFYVYKDILVPTPGRYLKTDRWLDPAKDLSGWGQ